jgi:hypothetical protein
MTGALALVFGGVEAGFIGFGGVRRGEICRVADMVGDTVSAEPPRPRISDRVSAAPARAAKPSGDTLDGRDCRSAVHGIGQLVAVSELH